MESNQIQLYDACRDGDIDLVKHFISNDFHVDIHLEDDRCALLAAANGHLDLIKYLIITHGINVRNNDYMVYQVAKF